MMLPPSLSCHTGAFAGSINSRDADRDSTILIAGDAVRVPRTECGLRLGFDVREQSLGCFDAVKDINSGECITARRKSKGPRVGLS